MFNESNISFYRCISQEIKSMGLRKSIFIWAISLIVNTVGI